MASDRIGMDRTRHSQELQLTRISSHFRGTDLDLAECMRSITLPLPRLTAGAMAQTSS